MCSLGPTTPDVIQKQTKVDIYHQLLVIHAQDATGFFARLVRGLDETVNEMGMP